MTPEDRTLDGAAVDEVADGAAETSPSSEAAPAESAGAPEAVAPDENAYHKALDAYMNGDLTGVVKLVDGVLEQKPVAGLKSRLERLRRRATDRLSREKIDGPAAEPSAVVEPAAEAVAASEPVEPAVAEPAVAAPPFEAVAEAAPEPVAAEPAVAEPAVVEPAVVEPEPEPEPEAPAPVVEAPPVESKPEVVAAPTPSEPPPAVAVAVAPKTETPVPPERAPKRPQAAPAPRPGGGVATRPSNAAPAPAGRPISKPAPAPVAGVRPRLSASSGSQPALTPPSGSSGATGGSLKAELDRVAGELDRLRKVVSGVEEHIVKVAEAYGKLAKDGKRKDQAYDQLYEELRQYKDNFLRSAQKPLFLDVVLLFDGISRTIAQFSDMPDEKVTRQLVVDALSHTRDEILELLYRRDIEKIQDATKKLDVAIQKPVTRIETENADEDRDIVSIVREGFRWSGVVLRPQEVVVKRSTKEREPQ